MIHREKNPHSGQLDNITTGSAQQALVGSASVIDASEWPQKLAHDHNVSGLASTAVLSFLIVYPCVIVERFQRGD